MCCGFDCSAALFALFAVFAVFALSYLQTCRRDEAHVQIFKGPIQTQPQGCGSERLAVRLASCASHATVCCAPMPRPHDPCSLKKSENFSQFCRFSRKRSLLIPRVEPFIYVKGERIVADLSVKFLSLSAEDSGSQKVQHRGEKCNGFCNFKLTF